MYGSIGTIDENNDKQGVAPPGTTTALDGTSPLLLPAREPSTAESRRQGRLRQRKSSRASRRLQNALRSSLILKEEEEQQKHPSVMKALFHSGKSVHSESKRKLLQDQSLHRQRRKSSLLQQKQQQEQLAAESSSASASLLPTTTTTEWSSTDQAKRDSNHLSKRPHHHTTHKFHHSWLYVLQHPRSRHPHAVWYRSFMSTVILVDLGFFVASTEQTWYDEAGQFFYAEEGLVSSIFLIDYLCRVHVAPESPKYRRHDNNNNFFYSRLHAQWQYMWTFAAMIDAVAALPFFLELPTGFSLPTLTWLRFFRLARILKAKSYVRSLETVWRVIYYNREILYVALNMCFLLVLITAVLMYYLRPKPLHHNVEDNDFSSLLATMYLSTMMLTGQGQPEGELPWYTKLVVLLTGFFSVAMFAIPASMLTWGFEAEAERCARKARQKYVASLQQSAKEAEEDDGNDDNDDNDQDECIKNDDLSYSNYISSSSSSSGGDTTDEEYLNIIAGGEADGGEENEAAANSNNNPGGPSQDEVVKQLIRTFQTSDVDASGALSMDEFIELMTDPSVASHHLTMVGMATSLGIMAKRVSHLEEELSKSHTKLDQILKAVEKNQGSMS